MDDRRREPRRRSLLGGSISFDKGQSTMDCVVRNISGHGALVVFPYAVITPGELMLQIPHRGELHAAKVVWRKGDRTGLALWSAEKVEAPVDASLRIRSLIAKNRRLKRQLHPGAW
jgi:hypothetical protein